MFWSFYEVSDESIQYILHADKKEDRKASSLNPQKNILKIVFFLEWIFTDKKGKNWLKISVREQGEQYPIFCRTLQGTIKQSLTLSESEGKSKTCFKGSVTRFSPPTPHFSPRNYHIQYSTWAPDSQANHAVFSIFEYLCEIKPKFTNTV